MSRRSSTDGAKDHPYLALVDDDAAESARAHVPSAPSALPRMIGAEPIVVGDLMLDPSGCYIQPAEHETISPFTAQMPIWPNISAAERGDVPDRQPDLPSGATLEQLYDFLQRGQLAGNKQLTIGGRRNSDLVGTQVRSGQIGLQTDSASRTKTYVYLPGCHTTYTQFTRSDIQVFTINLAEKTYIRREGTDFHLIVIPPQHRGLALQDGMPVELKAGIHVIQSNSLSFNPAADVFDTTTVYVGKGTAHFFNIPPGKMCAISINNVSYTLGPGSYEFNAQNLRCLSNPQLLPNISDAYYRNGTQHMMTVPAGQVALVQRDGQQMLYSAGRYFVNDPTLVKYSRGEGRNAVDFFQARINDKKGNYVSEVGPFTIITCGAGQIPVIYDEAGNMGIVTDRNTLTIRAPATLRGFIDTNVKTLDIYDLDEEDEAVSRPGGRVADAPDDVHRKLVVRTRDGVRLEISAVLTYRVKADQDSLMKTVLVDDLQQTLRRSALQELAAVYSRTSYFSDHKPVHRARRPEDDGLEEEGALREGAQQASLDDLRKELAHHYGIDVMDFRIIDCVPLDRQLLDKAAEQQAASMEVDLQMQNVQRRRDLAEQNSAVIAAEHTAKAKAEAAALEIRTKSQVDSMRAMQGALAEMSPAAQQAYLMQRQAEAQVQVIQALGVAMRGYAEAGGQVPAQLFLGMMGAATMPGMSPVGMPTMSGMPFGLFPQMMQQQQQQQQQQPGVVPHPRGAGSDE